MWFLVFAICSFVSALDIKNFTGNCTRRVEDALRCYQLLPQQNQKSFAWMNVQNGPSNSQRRSFLELHYLDKLQYILHVLWTNFIYVTMSKERKTSSFADVYKLIFCKVFEAGRKLDEAIFFCKKLFSSVYSTPMNNAKKSFLNISWLFVFPPEDFCFFLSRVNLQKRKLFSLL